MVLAEKALICCLKKMLSVCVQCYDQRIYVCREVSMEKNTAPGPDHMPVEFY
jgi:hypothetical protein